MEDKNRGWRKVLNAAFLGAICVAPLAGGVSAKAAPPNKGGGHDFSKSHDRPKRDDTHDSKSHGRESRDSHPDHTRPTPQTHTKSQPQTTRSHNSYKPHATKSSHSPFSSHELNRSRVTPQKHYTVPTPHQTWQRTDNNHYDDDWHRNHHYIRNGSKWNWRGHDDGWWISNGYGWNGSQWYRSGNAQHRYGTYHPNNYSSYHTFTGVVTKTFHGDDKVDVRINGRVFNVYVSRRLPRNLDRGDVVRVYGRRYGDNDIRNASINILRNR